MILRLDAPRFLLRRFDVHREPVCGESARHARTDAQQVLGAAAGRDGHHDLLGNDRAVETLAVPIFLRLAGLVGGELAQRELAQRRQVALAKEVGESLLDLGGIVDFPLAQSRAQRLDRDIDVDDLVGALENPIGNRLPHPYAGGRRDRIVQRFDVLDVYGSDDVDASVEQIEDVLVPFLVRRSGRVGVGELVHHHDLRPARLDRVDVRLFERHTTVLNLAFRHPLEIADTCKGIRPPVRLDEADDDV